MPENCAAIIIAAKHHELIKVKDTRGTTHTVGALRCKFDFRTNDWLNAAKTAMFCNGDALLHPEVTANAIAVPLDVDNECAVPYEVLTDTAPYSIGVWGVTDAGLRIVSKWLVFNAQLGCYTEGTAPSEPEPTIYEQILAISKNASDKADEIYNKANNGEFDGESAYELACKAGFKGTEQEWLDSLHGKDGIIGKDGYTPIKGVDYFDGAKGADGYTPVKGVDYFDGYTPVKGVDYFDGQDGKSAYQVALDNGFEGSESEWLDSLKGKSFTYQDWTDEDQNHFIENKNLATKKDIDDRTKDMATQSYVVGQIKTLPKTAEDLGVYTQSQTDEKISEAVSDFVGAYITPDDNNAIDKLQEISNWIIDDAAGAAKVIADVKANKKAIENQSEIYVPIKDAKSITFEYGSEIKESRDGDLTIDSGILNINAGIGINIGSMSDIILRDDTQILMALAPTQENHVVNKKYVDEKTKTASKDSAGLVKIGEGLEIDSTGLLSTSKKTIYIDNNGYIYETNESILDFVINNENLLNYNYYYINKTKDEYDYVLEEKLIPLSYSCNTDVYSSPVMSNHTFEGLLDYKTGVYIEIKVYEGEGADANNFSVSIEALDTALQEITTTENGGLKVTNKNQIDIDDEIVFILDCGTATSNTSVSLGDSTIQLEENEFGGQTAIIE